MPHNLLKHSYLRSITGWNFTVKDIWSYVNRSGQRTTITPESVNYKRKDYPSPFLTSFRQVQSMERRTVLVRETSLLSPLSVLLFTMGQLTVQEASNCVNEMTTPYIWVSQDRYDCQLIAFCLCLLILSGTVLSVTSAQRNFCSLWKLAYLHKICD